MEYLTSAEVLLIHARLIQRTGGVSGVRDVGLMESAVARPQATFGQNDLYPDVWSKAAALMHSLIKNHPFMDGNKRTALAAAVMFLEMNGYVLTVNSDGVLAFTRQAAAGGMELEEMAEKLKAHSGPLEGKQ